MELSSEQRGILARYGVEAPLPAVGMRFSLSVHRLNHGGGLAWCSSGPSASGVGTQAGGTSTGS